MRPPKQSPQVLDGQMSIPVPIHQQWGRFAQFDLSGFNPCTYCRSYPLYLLLNLFSDLSICNKCVGFRDRPR